MLAWYPEDSCVWEELQESIHPHFSPIIKLVETAPNIFDQESNVTDFINELNPRGETGRLTAFLVYAHLISRGKPSLRALIHRELSYHSPIWYPYLSLMFGVRVKIYRFVTNVARLLSLR